MHDETLKYVGLIVECPKLDEEVDCPFIEFRKMSFEDAFKAWKSLSRSDRKEVIDRHINCSLNIDDTCRK